MAVMTVILLTACSSNFEYEFNEELGGNEITKYIGDKEVVEIPAEIDGKNVVKIGQRAFSRCTRLTSVTITNIVTEIGISAFSVAQSLQA